MKRASSIATVILASLTLLVLVLSVPASLRETYDRGGLYLFSRSFIEDIPKRLAGPGWLRFILQPLVAIFLGIRSGLNDLRSGRPPYLSGVLFHKGLRNELLKSGFSNVTNLLLMGVLLDSLFQWAILGTSYAGAALVVGPMVIVAPYTVARALANRFGRPRKSGCLPTTMSCLPRETAHQPKPSDIMLHEHQTKKARLHKAPGRQF